MKLTPQPLITARQRLLVIIALMAVLMGVIVITLIKVSLGLGHMSRHEIAAQMDSNKSDDDTDSNKDAHNSSPPPLRLDITDRNGETMATTLRMASVYADPKEIQNVHEAAIKLAPFIKGETPKSLEAKLNKPGVRFLWLKRDITPREEYEINRLGIPGVDFRYEERRIYPMDGLAAHLVGYTDRDGNGIAGMEKSYDKQLRTGDKPLVLAIDSRVQHIVRRETEAAVEKFSGIGGIGMMMNVKTGEIVAMVSEPDFNPNTPGATSGIGDNDPKFNRAALGVYEMGSTFKSLTIAEALDSGKVKMFDQFDARQPIHIGKFKIDDFHPEYKIMDVPHVFIFSSNIGTVKIVEKLGTDLFKGFLTKIGMTKPAPIELPEIGRPIVPNPWLEISTMTIAFGHGISVSPAQLLHAESAMVNGGILVTPTLLKQPPAAEPKGERVISEDTSLAMRRLLRLNVLAGTGKKGAVPGYVVGGKTGTTEKAINGAYAKHRLISSFIAAFPMDDPQYVVLVMVDEPKPRKDTFGYATGGWVSAPPVANIIAAAAPILGVAPRDENAPELVQKLSIPGLDYARVIEEGKEH